MINEIQQLKSDLNDEKIKNQKLMDELNIYKNTVEFYKQKNILLFTDISANNFQKIILFQINFIVPISKSLCAIRK